MQIQNIDTSRAQLAAAVGVALAKAERHQSVDLMASAGAATHESDRKAPEKDALLSQATPKKGQPTKDEMERFYQLLAALGIMYRIQMKNFDATVDVLQVQGNVINRMAQQISSYSKQMDAVQEEIAKEQAEDSPLVQILEAIPMLIVGAVAAIATGGAGAAAVAIVVGLIITGMSIHWKQGGKSGFDELCKGIDETIGKGLSEKGKERLNFWFKIAFSLVVAAATAGAAGWATASNIATTAAEAAEETAESVEQSAARRGLSMAKRGLGATRAFLATPKGVAFRTFLDTTNNMLSKFTSENADGEEVTVFSGKGGEAAQGALLGMTLVLDVLGGTMNSTGNADSKLGTLGSILFQSGKLRGVVNTISAGTSLGLNINQAEIDSVNAALFDEMGILRGAIVDDQATLSTTEDGQQVLDTSLERGLSQVSSRSSGVFELERLMNQTMSAIYRG